MDLLPAYDFHSAVGVTTSERAVVVSSIEDQAKGRRNTVVADGTGWLVSPCLLLTNFHTVFGIVKDKKDMPKLGRSYHLYLRIGTGDAKGFASFSSRGQLRGDVVAFGDFTQLQDWALVKFKECPGLRENIGWIKLHPINVQLQSSTELKMFGFPTGRPEYSRGVNQDCNALRINGDFIYHTCITAPGASGGPLVQFRGGGFEAVGLAIGETHSDALREGDSVSDVGLALSVDAIRVSIPLDDMIRDDIRRNGR